MTESIDTLVETIRRHPPIRDGQQLYLPEPLIEVLGDIIIPRLAFRVTAEGTVEFIKEQEGLLASTDQRASAGLLPILRIKAQMHGVDWDLSGCDRNIHELPDPTPSPLVHPHVPEFVRQHPRGLIRLYRGVSAARAVAGKHRRSPAVHRLPRQMMYPCPTLRIRIDTEP